MTRDELIETLAAIEHQRWADWQKYLHSKARPHEYRDEKGEVRTGLIIHPNDWQHWERQIVQPYAMLSEDEKQSDRNEVMRYWPIIKEFFAEWLAARADVTVWDRTRLAKQWREETAP